MSRARTITALKEGWEIERTMDAWEETWQAASPMAATFDPRAYAPRPVGLVGISRVYEEPAIEQWSLTDLGLKAEEVGPNGLSHTGSRSGTDQAKPQMPHAGGRTSRASG